MRICTDMVVNNPWWNCQLSNVRSNKHYAGYITAKKYEIPQAVKCCWPPIPHSVPILHDLGK